MTTADLARLTRVPTARRETPYDHVAQAVQVLLGAEAALDRLHLIGNGHDAAAKLRADLRAVEARLFRALFTLSRG